MDNVAGVKIPVFEKRDMESKTSDLTGLASGGQKVDQSRATFVRSIPPSKATTQSRSVSLYAVALYVFVRRQFVKHARSLHTETFASPGDIVLLARRWLAPGRY